MKDQFDLPFNFLKPVITKSARKTKTKGTVIDHVLTNDFVNTDSSTGIVKSDISDDFPIFLVTKAQFFNNIQNKATNRKRINEKFKHYFMEILNKVNWKHLYSLTDTTLFY